MVFTRQDYKRNRLAIHSGIFVLLICGVILALSGWREWDTRASELHNDENSMSELTHALTQHAEDIVEMAEAILVGLVDRLETYGMGAPAVARLQAFADFRKAQLARVHGLFAYDETGRWILSSVKVDHSKFNNADRDYFQYHRDNESRATLIGHPVRSRSSHVRIVTLSRRINHPDGRFAGVALLTVRVAYFRDYFARFDVGPRGSISLMKTDGTLLARKGSHVDNSDHDPSDIARLRELPLRQTADVYRFTSPVDGLQRISVYRQSEKYPLLVMATKVEADILQEWRSQTVTRLSVVLVLVMLIASLGFYLILQLIRRQRVEVALLAREADFRLIAEECSDMVVRVNAEGRFLYISPSSLNVIGWPPEKLMQASAYAGVHPDDLPRVREVIKRLMAGEISEARLVYRNRHREKKEVWIESTARVTRAVTGEINGVVSIARDMTAHKNVENRLAELANLDGLTGIANRRQFDDRLAQEWARARRDRTPLALLLIDVDHFKKYNDRYGHQAGDRCLLTVARALSAAAARRPGDLAARYGGEEFALILPDTDAVGCIGVADLVRHEIRAAELAHADNPRGFVTVSLGGASMRPELLQAQIGGAALLEAADRALYQAKDSGRDQLVMASTLAPLHGMRSA